MSSAKVVEVSAETWEEEVLKSDIPVIVDFWHDRCGWCIELNPIYEEVSGSYLGKLKFVKLNVLESSKNQNIALKYGIMGTPTMKVFCNGRDVGEIVGFRSKNQLIEEIDGILQSRECSEKSSPLRI